tara:strand:+ start:272 stop:505 length:234 start_codon:yes stop_codon:yes gene_type:complete
MAIEKCSVCNQEFPRSVIGIDGRCRNCLDDDEITITKYHYFVDNDETKKVYDTETIKEEFEEKIEELEAHNEKVMEK